MPKNMSKCVIYERIITSCNHPIGGKLWLKKWRNTNLVWTLYSASYLYDIKINEFIEKSDGQV